MKFQFVDPVIMFEDNQGGTVWWVFWMIKIVSANSLFKLNPKYEMRLIENLGAD